MGPINSKYLLTGLVLGAIIVSGVLVLKKNSPAPPPEVSSASVQIKEKGTAGAPVEIVEFSDFQCPACARAEVPIQKILSAYPGKIHFIYRHFPLPGHRWAALAHQAAECAHQKGKFWDYHKRLYDEQAAWSALPAPAETFLRYAREMNLDLDAFSACLSNEEIRKKVQEEKLRGDALQVNSTPTFFVNGERVVGSIELETRGVDLIRKILGLPSLPIAVTPAVAPQTPAPAAITDSLTPATVQSLPASQSSVQTFVTPAAPEKTNQTSP